jgi:hypothetical protein
MATGRSLALGDASSEKVDEVFINDTDREWSKTLNITNPMTGDSSRAMLLSLNESQARSVFMFVARENEESNARHAD